MKDSRFRFTRDGEVYFNKKKTKYTIEYDTYDNGSKIYFIEKNGDTVRLPQDYLADAKAEVRKLILKKKRLKRRFGLLFQNGIWKIVIHMDLQFMVSLKATQKLRKYF